MGTFDGKKDAQSPLGGPNRAHQKKVLTFGGVRFHFVLNVFVTSHVLFFFSAGGINKRSFFYQNRSISLPDYPLVKSNYDFDFENRN